MSSSAEVLQSSSTLIETPQSSSKSFSLRQVFAAAAAITVMAVTFAAGVTIAVVGTTMEPTGFLACGILGFVTGHLTQKLGPAVYNRLKGPTP